MADKQIELAYFPIVGRGQQILTLCAEHDIKVGFLVAKPFGDDFDKDTQSPFGTLPWMKDPAEGLVLNDSLAIVQYLVKQYPGPATPRSTKEEALAANMWSWVQDYYSYVLSPLHDIIMDKSGDPFWRNLRLTDTLADGGKEKKISRIKTLHEKRAGYLEKELERMGAPQFLAGDGYTYADIFLFTSVRTTQLSKGFGGFRDACGGDPFAAYPNIRAICDRVEARPAVKASIGAKFENAPV